MKKQLPLIVCFFLSITVHSQIFYENGYYIDNNGRKTEGLIKNLDWASNPSEFKFKSSENSEAIKQTIKSVKEFGIYNSSKYVRSFVKIDRSPDRTHNLSSDGNPELRDEELFLKVLIEGDATLYQYIDGSLRRYFYKKENSEIEQLIFKRYKTADNQIRENTHFRQQLWNELNCNSQITTVQNLNYKENDLVKFFVEYNRCTNSHYINFEENQKRDVFNITIRPRINNSSLVIQNSQDISKTVDFGSKIGFGLGIEMEYILPFHKNKWSLIAEPTYQYFKLETVKNSDNVSGGKLRTDVNYSSVEIPVGVRHYFFLNDYSKIFINASYIVDVSGKSSIEYARNDGSILNALKIKSVNNFGFGVGYKHNNKYSVEFRYQTPREIFRDYLFWTSDYKTMSVIFGYSIF